MRTTTVLEDCIDQAFNNSSSRNSNQDNSDKENAIQALYKHTTTNTSPSCFPRGLERQISRRFLQQRQEAVRSVVQAQYVQVADNNNHQQEALLRMKSLLVSRKARQFAEKLGAADAEHVVSLLQQN